MSDVEDKSTGGPVSFRKPVKRRVETRKREEPKIVEKEPAGSGDESNEDQSSDSGNEAKIVRRNKTYMNSKRARKNPVSASSARRPNVNKNGNDSSSASDDKESDDSEDEERKKALDIDFKYSSSNTGDSTGPKDLGATARSEIDTEHEKDFQSQFERIQQKLKDEQPEPGSSDQKIYRGIKMYGAREAKDSVKGKASSGLNHYGPTRAQQFMRATVRWDYAPDICKDYKETGFCTFGDSCKFLHDRSDYKHGWEIEQDWQKKQSDNKKNQSYGRKNQEEDYTIHSDED
ncbi:hypothetical protein M3Y97_00961200 [Aphelenchoides bicaudatus]|nr:hypothetical protein M3Y97_00961200 [Aphelenchoides bicaudatus]